MIHWAALGMLFKTASWSIAYILFLAKGVSKLFFLNELTSSIYTLLFNMIRVITTGAYLVLAYHSYCFILFI